MPVSRLTLNAISTSGISFIAARIGKFTATPSTRRSMGNRAPNMTESPRKWRFSTKGQAQKEPRMASPSQVSPAQSRKSFMCCVSLPVGHQAAGDDCAHPAGQAEGCDDLGHCRVGAFTDLDHQDLEQDDAQREQAQLEDEHGLEGVLRGV